MNPIRKAPDVLMLDKQTNRLHYSRDSFHREDIDFHIEQNTLR